MAYATRAELKVHLGIPEADTADDARLDTALAAAEEQVNAHTGRSFSVAGVASARYYTATDAHTVHIDALASTTDLAVAADHDGDGTFEDSYVLDTDVRLAPYNAPAAGAPWTRLETIGSNYFPVRARGVRVTARWGGWAAVPASVKQATLIQATRLWSRKDARYGVAGTPEFGSEVRLLNRLDPDVELLLRPYRDTWVVV
jgi:hypothetical protein